MNDLVTVEHTVEHVTTITLDRPDRLNALNYSLVGALHDALDAVAGDDDCRVVILTGAGRGFCAGFGPGGHLAPPVSVSSGR